MNSSIEAMANDFATFTELIADAVLRKTHPAADEMSENEAQKAYGTRWLNRMRDSGLAEFTRRGNRKIYSRHQLDCLRAAETEHARLIIKEGRSHGTN